MYRFQSKSKIVIYDFLTYFMRTDLTCRRRLGAWGFCRGTASCSFVFAAMTKSKVNICDFTFEQWPDVLMICCSTMISLRAKRGDP